MRSKFILVATIFLLSACIGAGENSVMQPVKQGYFPQLQGIDLLGEDRAIPETFAGQLNIVAVAFKREQQSDVDPWISVALDIMQDDETVRFYELPVIYEASATFRAWVNNGMRSGIADIAARERTITIYTNREAFLEEMNMTLDRITLLLLDNRGKILWRSDGSATKQKVIDLKAKIQDYKI